MFPLSRPIFVLLAAAALTSGCGKKKEPQAASQPAVPAPAASVSVGAPPADAASAEAASGSAPRETPGAAAGGAPSPSSGVAPSLAAADAAFEAWFKKHRLNLTDPNMLDADADGDGVSNRDEFMADTDPRDPSSHPTATAGGAALGSGNATVSQSMRLKEFNEVSVPFVLESVDGETARIRHTGGGATGGKVETVRAGQTLPESAYKVERVLSRRGTDKMGEPVDASRVTLEDPATKERVALVKNMPARSPASYAVLTSPNGKTTLTVRQGDTFNWPSDAGVTYKVIDLRADQVVLQHVETGGMVTVPKK